MKKHTNPNALRARASRVSRRLDENPKYVFGVLGIFAVVVMILAQTFTRLNTASTLDRVFASTVGILGASFFVALAVAIWVGETTAETERARARKNATRLIAERDASDTAYEHLRDEYRATVAEYATVRNERDALRASHALVVAERDALADERDALARELDAQITDALALVGLAQDSIADKARAKNEQNRLARDYARGARTFTVEIAPLFHLDGQYSARVDVYADGVTSRTAIGLGVSKGDAYADALVRACDLVALSARDASPYALPVAH